MINYLPDKFIKLVNNIYHPDMIFLFCFFQSCDKSNVCLLQAKYLRVPRKSFQPNKSERKSNKELSFLKFTRQCEIL